MPRVYSRVSSRALAVAHTSIRQLRSTSAASSEQLGPSLAEPIDISTVMDQGTLQQTARALGCNTDELVAYPDTSDLSKTYITAKPLTVEPSARPSFLDWRVNLPPAELKTPRSKAAYRRPLGLNDAFKEALGVISEDRNAKHAKILELEDGISQILGRYGVKSIGEIPDPKQRNQAFLMWGQARKLRVYAEINSPEVVAQFDSGKMDMRFPVYQHLAKSKWEKGDRLLLMDRLETMHVIPDTMATLYPTVDVKLRFPGTTSHWIEPGKLLSTGVTARAPVFSIQMFEDHTKLYTIVIVDPDTPDLVNDSYTTTLHYILCDVKISGNSPLVLAESARELVPYLPPHPEKNSGNHRYAVWVFEQPGQDSLAIQSDELLQRKNFDIRRFRSAHHLKAVGAHFWRNGYDSKTEAVRERFNLGPGLVYSHIRYQHYEDYVGRLPDIPADSEVPLEEK